MNATGPEVLDRTLEMPDVAVMRELYGVEFVAATPEEVRPFDDLRDKLIDEAAKHRSGPQSDRKPTAIYRPQVFLNGSLTPDQVAKINSSETHAIAEYCVGVQTELAKVPIEESHEPLVSLPALFEAEDVPASFSTAPFHAACGDWAGKPREFWARQGFAEKLVLMGKLVGSIGLQLCIEDAFRPVGVQEGLFKRRIAWTRDANPDWSEEQVLAEARSKTAIMPRLASHKGAAAVDARLQDTETGEILDIGHNYPDGGALVFPTTPFVTAEQWRNRQLFQLAAGLSGLTLYVGEDWHISYGDNLAALDENGIVRPNYIAKYGPIKDFDHTTGTILTTYDSTEMDVVFPS